jgi:hypothetical protein
MRCGDFVPYAAAAPATVSGHPIHSATEHAKHVREGGFG